MQHHAISSVNVCSVAGFKLHRGEGLSASFFPVLLALYLSSLAFAFMPPSSRSGLLTKT